MKWKAIALLMLLGCLACPVAARADGSTTRPNLLGDEFRSDVNGISLRPPVNCDRMITNVPDQIVEFDDTDRKWVLKVTRRSLDQPLPLTAFKDQYGGTHEGLMDLAVKQLQQEPLSQLATQDVTHIGAHGETPVGLLGVRYDRSFQRRLHQEAIVEANDQLYYVLDMDTPARPGGDATADDPAERMATDAFSQVVQSVKLLDLGVMYEDQTDRLLRTRAWIANWTPTYLKSRIVPEQFLRLVRDGKDIGFSYEVEVIDAKAGAIAGEPVVSIGVRSETQLPDGGDVQVQSCLTVTLDRKHEEWNNSATSTLPPSGQVKVASHTLFSELGISNATTQMRPLVQPGKDVIQPIDPTAHANDVQPGWTMKESRSLTVVRHGIDLNNPSVRHDYPEFKQQLPAFYIPQALNHLAVRLVQVREAKTYLFATYVPDGDHGNPAVMMRYLDVLPPAEVRLDDKVVVAVPVRDHLGIDGPVTTHYLDADDGSYLGSSIPVTEADGTSTTETLLPTDAATLRRLWPASNLTPPDHFLQANAATR